MRNLTTPEIVGRLIGYTLPYGEPEVDEIRLNNQDELIGLCRDAIDELKTNASYYDRTEYSMSKIGVTARNYLNELKDELNDLLN